MLASEMPVRLKIAAEIAKALTMPIVRTDKDHEILVSCYKEKGLANEDELIAYHAVKIADALIAEEARTRKKANDPARPWTYCQECGHAYNDTTDMQTHKCP